MSADALGGILLVSRFPCRAFRRTTGVLEARRQEDREKRRAAAVHALNFGFADGRLTVVFDFDSLERGLPCEDLAYALCEDMRRGGQGACRRVRLLDLFARFRARAPWPTEDWLIAVNHARLRIAARRLEKHPHNPLVALDVLRRDRLLRPLVAACLQEMV